MLGYMSAELGDDAALDTCCWLDALLATDDEFVLEAVLDKPGV